MATMLEHANSERQNRFGEKLDQLRQASPSPETYERFNEKLENIVEQVDEIILELQDEREAVKARKGEFKDQYGETQLQLLREEDADHVKLGEEGFEGKLRQLNRKLEDWATYRAEVQRIGRLKNKQVMDQVDAQEIKVETLKRLDEITEERVKNVDAKIGRTQDELRAELRAFKQEMKEERRAYREAIREEHDRNWELISEVLQSAIATLQQLGADVDRLQTALQDRVDHALPVTAAVEPDTAASADGEETEAAAESSKPAYRFADRDWDERYETLQTMIAEESVAELSREEIAALTDLDVDALYDASDGVLPQLEEKFGDQYPELY